MVTVFRNCCKNDILNLYSMFFKLVGYTVKEFYVSSHQKSEFATEKYPPKSLLKSRICLIYHAVIFALKMSKSGNKIV